MVGFGRKELESLNESLSNRGRALDLAREAIAEGDYLAAADHFVLARLADVLVRGWERARRESGQP